MKNIIKLAFKLQKRKKSTMYNVLFITISFLVLFFVNTYSDSAINYVNSDVYNSVFFKSLEVLVPDYEESEDIIELLNDLEHVELVTNFYAYSSILNSSEFINQKFDGSIYFYVANNASLPTIIYGSTFPDSDGNYLICPKTLYATTDNDSLKYISTMYTINMLDYLDKEIEFTYSSNYGTNNYTETYKVVGLYESESYLDANICYTTNSSLQTIVENHYSDDTDYETGESNLIYQTSIFVQIDDVSNMEYVKQSISEMGYNVEENAIIITEYFDNIQNTAHIILLIVIFVTLIILLILNYKKFDEDRENYRLLKWLGYRQNKIKILLIFSNLFALILALLISIAIFMIIYGIFQIILIYYPYIMNNWKVCINYSGVVIILIVCLISYLIGIVICLFKLNKERL